MKMINRTTLLKAVFYGGSIVFSFDLFYQFLIIAKFGVVHVIEPNPIILYSEIILTGLVGFLSLYYTIKWVSDFTNTLYKSD